MHGVVPRLFSVNIFPKMSFHVCTIQNFVRCRFVYNESRYLQTPFGCFSSCPLRPYFKFDHREKQYSPSFVFLSVSPEVFTTSRGHGFDLPLRARKEGIVRNLTSFYDV